VTIARLDPGGGACRDRPGSLAGVESELPGGRSIKLRFGHMSRARSHVILRLALPHVRLSIMRSDIQAVVFDLDGTLLDRRRSFERFVRDQWERFSHALSVVHPDTYVQLLIQRDRDGYAPRQELFTGLVAQFELPATLADSLLSDYRAGFPSACVLFPDVTATLAALRAAGFKLGLITNGSLRMQSRKLECLSLSSSFDVILISAAEGLNKPDPAIFHRALQRLDIDPADAIFVGDHPDVDIRGARAAGMQTVWRRDPTTSEVVEADATIAEVGDLLTLLGLEPGSRPGYVR
jgi:putative hydrolase of the HAD superfamily